MARPDHPMRRARTNRPSGGPSANPRPAAPPLTLPGLELAGVAPDVAHYRRLLARIEADLRAQRTEPRR